MLVTGVATPLAVIWGALSAFFSGMVGGRLDEVLMRVWSMHFYPYLDFEDAGADYLPDAGVEMMPPCGFSALFRWSGYPV